MPWSLLDKLPHFPGQRCCRGYKLSLRRLDLLAQSLQGRIYSISRSVVESALEDDGGGCCGMRRCMKEFSSGDVFCLKLKGKCRVKRRGERKRNGKRDEKNKGKLNERKVSREKRRKEKKQGKS